LQYLQRYYQLIVLTNADKGSFARTARRLETRFDAVFTAEEIGSYKPDPRNFEYLMARLGDLGLRKEAVLHVGASLERDQVPAGRCGLEFALIDRQRRAADPIETPAPSQSARGQFHFPSIVDMVKAHQEELLA
jgi:2-haloacid dehalogenase